MSKDAWTDCVSWEDRPKGLSEGLKILADWFDAVYEDQGKNDQVQKDLRRWAADVEQLVEAARESDKVFIKMLKCFSGNLDYSRDHSQFVEKLLMELRAALEPFIAKKKN